MRNEEVFASYIFDIRFADTASYGSICLDRSVL